MNLTGLDSATVKVAIGAMLASMKKELQTGGYVTVQGFGTLLRHQSRDFTNGKIRRKGRKKVKYISSYLIDLYLNPPESWGNNTKKYMKKRMKAQCTSQPPTLPQN